MMAIIKHTRPISLTAFPLQRTQRLYLCLAVNWSGSIQKESQPLMKRQYPGKRQNYAKFCTGSKYGEKRSPGERKKITGRGRMCGLWQIWKMGSWLSNKWPNILMWALCAYMCHICEGKHSNPSLICCLCGYVVSIWSHLAALLGHRVILVPVPL